MIISHKHRFIFLKTNKTAGTSIEIALSRFCGPEDVITRLPKPDEKIRADLGYPGPRNYEAPLSEYGPRDYWRRLTGRRKPRFTSHSTASEVRPYLTNEAWSSYYKFCIERNPWDRMVSLYYWRTKAQPDMDLDSFLDSPDALRLKRRGIDLYSIDGKIIADKVCLFENLEADLEAVRQTLGLSEPLSLPRSKTGSRKDKRHYREILTEDQKNRIGQMFSKEIELYGYQY